jgi:hypothetical protein
MTKRNRRLISKSSLDSTKKSALKSKAASMAKPSNNLDHHRAAKFVDETTDEQNPDLFFARRRMQMKQLEANTIKLEAKRCFVCTILS